MNVLAICADTFRADYLGCYGNQWIETPNLDALANDGLLFEQAYAEGLPTLPARRVYFTGRRLFPRWEVILHKGDHLSFQPAWHAIPEEEDTLAELLSEQGITCGFITDVYHYFKPTGNFHRGFHSFEFIRGQEADRYRSGPSGALAQAAWATESPDEFELSSLPAGQRQYLLNVSRRAREEDYFVAQVMVRAARWLEDNRDNLPFFLWVDCFDPHEPWDPPLYDADRYHSEDHHARLIFAPSTRIGQFSQQQRARVKALYAGEVALVDRWIGYMLHRLEELRLADDTAVIFTSDHGTLLGELGAIHKKPWGLVQPETRLPLIVRLPNKEMMGKRVHEYVSAVDIAPTVLALLGQPVPESMEGRSLVDVAGGRKEGYESVVSAYGPYASIRTDTHNFVAPYRELAGTPWHTDPQPPRLFRLGEDLCETDDVTTDESAIAESLQAQLSEIARDHRALGSPIRTK
jgi:arylsulfatase A-like enzyme